MYEKSTQGRAIRLVFKSVIASLMLVVFAYPSVLPAQEWDIEVLDNGKRFWDMTDRSFVVDAYGHPHIAYGRDWLYYSWHDGVEWHYEVADSSFYVGAYASLVLDATGAPHICYFDGANGDLKYAYKDGMGWHIETVDTQQAGWSTSIVLDEMGDPHISYAKWITVGSGYDARNYVDDLKYAHRVDSGWHLQTIDTDGYVGLYTSIDLDCSGLPHISYYDYTNNDLKYAYWDGMEWQIESVDVDGYVGRYSSLALDDSDSPHISYYDCTNRALKYTYRDGATWHMETLDTVLAGWYTSLALDETGSPKIAYATWFSPSNYYDEVDDLKYAWKDAGGWQIETIHEGPGIGRHTSLFLDTTGYPHVSYTNAYGDLYHAFRDEAGWQIQTVDRERNAGRHASMALDNNDNTHVSYEDYYGLRYSIREDQVSNSQRVDETSHIRYTSIALDSFGTPHISFHAPYPNEALKYAYHDESGWHVETVDPCYGYSTSIALDSGEVPHISYYRAYPDQDLKYARLDETGWQIQTVDSEGDVGSYTSLAIDACGSPHISYYDDTNDDLKYAFLDETGWQIQTVDSEGDVGQYCSLDLDSNGLAHICYYNATSTDLKYARMLTSALPGRTMDVAALGLPSQMAVLEIWPNPARDVIHSRLVQPEGQNAIRLTLFDLLGRRIMRLEQPHAARSEARITFRLPDTIPAGQYFVRFEGDGSGQCVPVTIVR